MSAAEVVQYIQDQWSQFGIEVQSCGDKSITLSLPPDVPELSTLCLDLESEFGASVDLKHPTAAGGACLTVRLGNSTLPRNTDSPPPTVVVHRNTVSSFAVIATLLLTVCSVAVVVSKEYNLFNVAASLFDSDEL